MQSKKHFTENKVTWGTPLFKGQNQKTETQMTMFKKLQVYMNENSHFPIGDSPHDFNALKYFKKALISYLK